MDNRQHERPPPCCREPMSTQRPLSDGPHARVRRGPPSRRPARPPPLCDTGRIVARRGGGIFQKRAEGCRRGHPRPASHTPAQAHAVSPALRQSDLSPANDQQGGALDHRTAEGLSEEASTGAMLALMASGRPLEDRRAGEAAKGRSERDPAPFVVAQAEQRLAGSPRRRAAPHAPGRRSRPVQAPWPRPHPRLPQRLPVRRVPTPTSTPTASTRGAAVTEASEAKAGPTTRRPRCSWRETPIRWRRGRWR